MKRISTFVFLLAGLLSAPAMSTDLNFLSQSPVRYYTEQDWKLFQAATDEALNKKANGQKVTWSNPVSGSHGMAQPLNTTTKNGVTCRNLKIFNSAKDRTDQYVFLFCKYPGGWKIPSDGI